MCDSCRCTNLTSQSCWFVSMSQFERLECKVVMSWFVAMLYSTIEAGSYDELACVDMTISQSDRPKV